MVEAYENNASHRCADHPDALVEARGKETNSRRARLVCLADPAAPHTARRAITEDLLGICVACERDWDHGYAVAEHAWYHLRGSEAGARGRGVPQSSSAMRTLERGEPKRA